MPIRQITPMSEIDRYMEQRLKGLEQAAIRTLAHCGEVCRNVAVSRPSPPQTMAGKPHKPNYIDWSNNLRSSIGYVVAVNGRIVIGKFEAEQGGQEGAEKGAAFAKQLVRRFPKGICLIVVAGMEYAVHVQNKGYDVLDSAELTADRIVPNMLKQLRM